MENAYVVGFDAVLPYALVFGLSLVFAALAQALAVQGGTARPRGRSGAASLTRLHPFFWLLSLGVIVALTAVRYNVGIDFYNYQVLYQEINAISGLKEFIAKSSQTEPGYMLLNMLAYRLFDSEQMVFALSALFILGFFWQGLARERRDVSPVFGILLFYMVYYSQTVNIIRQAMAVAVIFYAQRYLYQRKFWPFAAWVLFAALFHNTALIVLPFYFAFGTAKWHRYYRYGLYALIILLLGVVLVAPASLLQGLLQGVLPDLELAAEGGFGLGITVKRLPLVIPLFLILRRQKENRKLQVWWHMFLFSILLYNFGYIYVVFNRIAGFFEIFLFLLLPAATKSIENRRLRTLTGLYFIGYMLFWGYLNYIVYNIGGSLPYQTFWQAR